MERGRETIKGRVDIRMGEQIEVIKQGKEFQEVAEMKYYSEQRD
jgi:hypothetical protein